MGSLARPLALRQTVAQAGKVIRLLSSLIGLRGARHDRAGSVAFHPPPKPSQPSGAKHEQPLLAGPPLASLSVSRGGFLPERLTKRRGRIEPHRREVCVKILRPAAVVPVTGW